MSQLSLLSVLLKKKVLKKGKSLKKVLKKVNTLKKVLQNALLFKVKYLLQKLLDYSELWLEALQSSIKGWFQSKKTLNWPAGPIVAASGK